MEDEHSNNLLISTLQQIQEAKGFNDIQFAEFIGIDNSAWSLIKRGKRNPNVETLQRILKALPELEPIVMQYINPPE